MCDRLCCMAPEPDVFDSYMRRGWTIDPDGRWIDSDLTRCAQEVRRADGSPRRQEGGETGGLGPRAQYGTLEGG